MFKWLKGNQGVEKLFPTQGCITEHILHVHLQANIARPILLDPVTLGRRLLEDSHYVPVA